MYHVRIASYDLTAGTFEELSELVQQPGGMADVFRATPGFIAYTVADHGDGTITSISIWQSSESAEEAVRRARNWVAANVADRVRLTANKTGRLGVLAGELIAAPA